MEEYKIPKEHQPLPPEHSIPEEFPVSKPQQTTKKKSSTRRLMAVLASSFMVLQVMFSYFVPPTDEIHKDPIYTEPGYVDPGYTDPNGSGSGSTNKPSYDIGSFEVKSLDADIDDTILRSYLEDAAQHFENFDYVRASLALFQTMRFFDTRISFSDLPMVGYSVVNGTAQDFDPSAAPACHVYYNSEAIYYENKIGEMEAVYGTRAILVQMQPTEQGRAFRVISVWISFDSSFGGSTDYVADYIEGVFTADGSSDLCSRIHFTVFESPEYPDFDEKYAVWAHGKYTGSVQNDSFMNETLLETKLTYVDGQGIVNDPDQAPLNIRFQCLDEQGIVDLTHPALSDMTADFDPEVNDRFYNDPSVRYMAQLHGLGYKYDGSEEYAWIEVQDISKPLLPLKMHAALCIGQLIADSGADVPEPITPGVDYSLYTKGLTEASQYLMAIDYVGASIALTDTFREQYETGLSDARFVWINGALVPFDGQYLTDGSGVYIYLMEQIVMVYNEKVDDYDPEMHLQATLIYATDLSAEETDTKIVTVTIPYYYLGQGNAQGTYCYSTVMYFDGVLDHQLASQRAGWVTYTLETSDRENLASYRDGYYLSNMKQAQGAVASNHFYGNVQYRFDGYLTLAEDKTAVVPKAKLENHVFGLDLDSNGVLDMNNIEFHDARAYEPGSAEAVQANSDFSLDECPYVYQIVKNGDGGFTLRVKAMQDENGERVNLILNIIDTSWEQERFPLSNTMDVWRYYCGLIR